MDSYASVNKIYKEFFNESKPARAAFAVAALPAGVLVEIECVACLAARQGINVMALRESRRRQMPA